MGRFIPSSILRLCSDVDVFELFCCARELIYTEIETTIKRWSRIIIESLGYGG